MSDPETPTTEIDPFIEDYIRGLHWTDTPDDVVTLVVGNIRGFAVRYAAHQLAEKDAVIAAYDELWAASEIFVHQHLANFDDPESRVGCKGECHWAQEVGRLCDEIRELRSDPLKAAAAYRAELVRKGVEEALSEVGAEHIVQFSETGYGLQHPLRCRPNLLDCSLEKWLAARSKPAEGPGRYVMTLTGRRANFRKVEE